MTPSKLLQQLATPPCAPIPIDDMRAALKAGADALALLRELANTGGEYACAVCGDTHGFHLPDCRLAALVTR